MGAGSWLWPRYQVPTTYYQILGLEAESLDRPCAHQRTGMNDFCSSFASYILVNRLASLYSAVKYRHFRNDSLSISGARRARCTLAQL